jgi:hypothetical protein
MEITIPVFDDLTLKIADQPDEKMAFATSRLQKGLILKYQDMDLAEEAVGFGFPVLKRGLQTYFPGNVALDFAHNGSTWVVTAVYTINLVEKIARPNQVSLNNQLFYAAKNSLAAFIRSFPPIRGFLTTLSSGLRRLFSLETTYEISEFTTQVKMSYDFDEQTGLLIVEADFTRLPQGNVTEAILMNEQGAHYFDQYRDSAGVSLTGDEIGCWDEVAAEEASFVSSSHQVSFTLPRVGSARLFRGRELNGSRLAWSGFGYSFPPSASRFSYSIRIEKLL